MNSALAGASPPPLPSTPFQFVLYFIRPQRWWLLLIILLEVGASSSTILLPYALSKIIAAVTAGVAADALFTGALYIPLLLFVGLNLGEVILGRAGAMCRITVGPRIRTQVTRDLFAYLQHHSHRYFSNNFAGALASRVSEAAMGVNMTVWALIFDFLPIAVTLLVSIAVLAGASKTLSLFVLGWAVVFIGVSFYLARRCRPYAQRSAEARSTTVGKVVDAVTNLSSIRLFARLGFEQDYLNGYLQNELNHSRRWMWANERTLWFQYTASFALKIGILLLALRLWRDGQISVGEFVMSVSSSLLIINEARNIGRRFVDLFEYIGNVANSVFTIVRPHDISDSPQASTLHINRGVIEFDSVRFGYTADRPVFDNLNLRIEAGQRVGLVGHSGSGKSTLVSLILRMYDPQQGAILIDGQDIRAVTQDSLHSQISLIPQDPGLFHRTLYDNIRYGRPEAAHDEIMHASVKAQAHEFIQHVPDQYESLVGERGIKLSGGQRQRISIARVIVKNAPIVIMDEATSSLDSITEKAIQDSLDELMKDRTVIVVAHRLSTIAHLDRILVFDHGRIVEDGSHSELLAKNGAYARLWNRQVDGFFMDEKPTDQEPVENAEAVV